MGGVIFFRGRKWILKWEDWWRKFCPYESSIFTNFETFHRYSKWITSWKVVTSFEFPSLLTSFSYLNLLSESNTFKRLNNIQNCFSSSRLLERGAAWFHWRNSSNEWKLFQLLILGWIMYTNFHFTTGTTIDAIRNGSETKFRSVPDANKWS